MILGTTPPEELWPNAPALYGDNWHREQRLLISLLELKRSQRNAALEILCACPKSHLLLTVIALPNDEVALWFNGGGRIADGQITPSGKADELSRFPTLPHWYSAPHSLDIRELQRLRDGRSIIGTVAARCDAPFTIRPEDGPGIAAAVDKWKSGTRRKPVLAHLAP